MRKIILISLSAIFVANVALGQTPPPSNQLSQALSKSDCPPSTRAVSTITLDQKGVNVLPNNTTVTLQAFYSGVKDCSPTLASGSQTIDLPSRATADNKVDFPIALLLPSGACAQTGSSSPLGQNVYMCIYTGGNLVGKVIYQYDTSAAAIVAIEAIAGDEQITVIIDDPKSVGRYEVCYGQLPPPNNPNEKVIPPEEFEIDAKCDAKLGLKLQSCSSTTCIISKLANGTPYIFKARVTNGDWSEPIGAAPVESFSFTDVYDGDPNPIQVDCNQGSTSSSAMGLWGFLGLLLLGLRTRVRNFHKGKIGSLFVALLFSANSASADFGQINLSVNGAPYLPNIDASKPAAGKAAFFPFYRCMFGKAGDVDGPLLPLMGIAVDLHLTDAFGSLQLGIGGSYTFAGGKAMASKPAGAACPALTDSDVGMHLFQIRPQLTYILDPWIESFPFAPYIRGGLVGAGYVFTFQGKPDPASASNPNAKNSGMVFGWEAAVGMLFLLDVIEPSVSANARALGTYDHTYLKVEASYMPINNFDAGGMDLSPKWPIKEFPLMLTFGLVFEFQ